METVMAQMSHLDPAEIAEFLVKGKTSGSVNLEKPSLVHFVEISHAFNEIKPKTQYHCLHWSSSNSMQSPAVSLPVVGDCLRKELIQGLLRTVNKKGNVSLFSPKRKNYDFIGMLHILRMTDGTISKNVFPLNNLWSFYSQINVEEEESEYHSISDIMDLLSKKIVMWLFHYFSIESNKQITLRQLEFVFPILTAMNLQDRCSFINKSVTRFSSGLISFYDNRAISLRDIPVNAFSLLSTKEFSLVTSIEYISVAFIFKCQMRHEEVLEALQIILDSWGKGGTVLPSIIIRKAFAVLISHIMGTCALLSYNFKSFLRPLVLYHLPMLLTFHEESITTKLISLLRSSKSQKKSNLLVLRENIEKLICKKIIVLVTDFSSTERKKNIFGDKEEEEEEEENAGYIFDSVAPTPHIPSSLTWKITRETCRHINFIISDNHRLRNVELIGTVLDNLFISTFFSGTRLQISRPLLKCSVDEEMFLSLNIGKAPLSTVDDETVWQTSRKRRR